MNSNRMIARNLLANVKNHFLYVFALLFSAALYFAFVTLQYDPALNEMEGSVKGGAAIGAASVLLVAIIGVFNLYANNLFMRRRGKEFGLLQLAGLTRGAIFRIVSGEQFLLYFGAIAAGVLLGFSASRLILLALLRIMQIEAPAELRFSPQALLQTVIVFGGVYVFITLVNFLFLRRQSILSLFHYAGTREAKAEARRLTVFDVIGGVLGLALIGTGYWVSSRLFSGDFQSVNELMAAMIGILGSVIFGTYLFYKGSVRLIFDLIRRRKKGYLSVRAVLSLSSILFRMRSNALLLMIITTVSALAIGLLSLSYISYYSAERNAAQNVAAHFSMEDPAEADAFLAALAEAGIAASDVRIPTVPVTADFTKIVDGLLEGGMADPAAVPIPAVSDADFPAFDVAPGEILLSGYSDLMQKVMPLRSSGELTLNVQGERYEMTYLGLERDTLLSYNFTGGGLPTAVVDETVFERLAGGTEPRLFIGIHLEDTARLAEADALLKEMELDSYNLSQIEMYTGMIQQFGLILFIFAFLGLAFLVMSGCILYFKQMDESESERPTYTTLRKLGFSEGDLLRGVRLRQLFNFGIPLAVGLAHSYFAVQSGWFLFGTELWTPMLLVMALYTALYSIFGFLSVLHYKKVIRESL